MQLDLASLGSVRGFCDQFLSEESRCDILVNNAGVMACPKGSTLDGFEYQLGVNHLGHFLLTTLLLDLIKASQPSRIVNVSSKAGIRDTAQIHFDDIHLDREYMPWKAYGQSKLANILFTVELAKRLKGTGVTVNCCHPGLVMTNLGRHMEFPIWKKILFAPFVLLMFKTPYYGAQTQIYLSVSPEVENVSGFYFADCRAITQIPAKCTNEDDALRLWNKSEELVSYSATAETGQ
ncbi:retinol dehydrogenase 14-like [Convolutriloba macropyga]|uniref:retinol dehydrogenase 14-like n=1 Tax=Convolutriloba macropyga TaxID=536237 RepID=UPI003F51D570